MKTLVEIERAADALSSEDKQKLIRFQSTRLGAQALDADSWMKLRPQGRSVLNIEPVSLGRLRQPVTADDDLPGKMLEGRT
jgi:hypothetical protein